MHSQVLGKLKEVYQQYPEHDLYLTGHSLGSAIAQLFAFELAEYLHSESSPRNDELSHLRKGPLNIISFAAPQVGNEYFAKAFRIMEKKRWLRLVRFSNEGDLVPIVGAGWTRPTGVAVFLRASPTEPCQSSVAYETKSRNFLSQFGGHWNVVENHNMFAYMDRFLRPGNEALRNMTVEELYEKYGPLNEPHPDLVAWEQEREAAQNVVKEITSLFT
eukprot:scaffold6577_cov175-Amphora_coffeaeformis.AAC.7